MIDGTNEPGRLASSHVVTRSRPGQLTPLVGVELTGPASDLALVEVVGATEVGDAGGDGVDVVHPGQGIGEGEGQLDPTGGVVEPLRNGQRVDAVDAGHQVEGAAQHGMVVAQGDRRRVRHRGALERADEPELAAHAVVGPLDGDPGRAPQHPAGVTPLEAEHHVGGAAGDLLDDERGPRLEALVVEPRHQPVVVEQLRAHRPHPGAGARPTRSGMGDLRRGRQA